MSFALLVLSSPTHISAHHAFAAEFDINKPITLRGTVTKMDWINPHSWIHLEVTGADGKTVAWIQLNCLGPRPDSPIQPSILPSSVIL